MQPTEKLTLPELRPSLAGRACPGMGCTEPIAIAYGAAKAREVLGCLPDKVLVEASGNIIKNVKSVVVPNTGGLHGIEASAAAGIVAGKAELVLEVISQVTPQEQQAIRDYMATHEIQVRPAKETSSLTSSSPFGREKAMSSSASPTSIPTSSTSKRTARSCWNPATAARNSRVP